MSVNTESTEYQTRRQTKQVMDDSRTIARKWIRDAFGDGGTVSEHANVHPMPDGAFVEAQIWVPHADVLALQELRKPSPGTVTAVVDFGPSHSDGPMCADAWVSPGPVCDQQPGHTGDHSGVYEGRRLTWRTTPAPTRYSGNEF